MPNGNYPDLVVYVIGTPAPQGSKKHVGRGIMVESSKKLAPWREDVKSATRAALLLAEKVIGPVRVQLTFTLRKPKSAPKRRQSWPDKSPDLDKLTRGVFDSLKQAGAIEDDARVVRMAVAKVFPGEGEDSLDVPGAVIRIWSVTA